MFHRRTTALAALAAGFALVALAGCSSTASPKPSSSGSSAPSGPVTISFWHEASGAQAAAITQLVGEFNSREKGKITVNASYQGTYADAQTKYTAAVQSNSTPSIIAMNDTSTGFMADSKQTVPIYTFAANDKSFNTKTIPEAALKYYGSAKGLLSMPYAVSQPMLYINPSIATAAGLDPTKPPTTLDQVAQWAQQIKSKTGNYGFSMNMVDSWILEELSASGGSIFCTPENGRSGKPVTGIDMTTDNQVKLLTTLQKLFQSGVALNPGTNSATMTAAFTSGKVGMVLTSSAAYTAMKPNANAQVTVAQFPRTSNSKSAGAAIGGASLWISGPGHSEAEQQAAYEFAKFMEAAETQATWSKATGYLSTNTGSATLPAGKAALADANVKVMYQQLKDNPASVASSGCRMGPYAAVRTIVIGAFNKIITGGDVKTEMKQAEQQAKAAIAQYNSAAK